VPLNPRADPVCRDWGGVVLGGLAILLGSIALGLLVNHFSAHGIPVVQRVEAGRLQLPAGLREISLTQTKAAVDGKTAVLLDARSPEEYVAGHIPGALDVPRDQIGDALPKVEDRILQAPRVIVYCETDDCGDAISVAELAAQIVPNRVSVLVGGWHAWTDARYPLANGE